MNRYSLQTVAIACPDCEEFHRLKAWTIDGRFPNQIAVGSGPGAGWLYSPTGEDLGLTDGLSIPVYRMTSKFETPSLPVLPWGTIKISNL